MVGPVVPIVVAVVTIAPTVGSAMVQISNASPNWADARPVPAGATVCRNTPTSSCWLVGGAALVVRTPTFKRRSRNPVFADAPQYPIYPLTVVPDGAPASCAVCETTRVP